MPKPDDPPPPSNAYRHINRANEAYYLQTKPDGRGKMRHSFARKISGTPCPQIPEGYEVREDPRSAQVTLRKRQPSMITDQEVAWLTDTVHRTCPTLLFIIEREPRALVIFTCKLEIDSRLDLMRSIAPISDERAATFRRLIIEQANYHAMLKFSLAPGEPRLFYAYRWHFSGSIDDWISIGHDAQPLATLANRYVKHLDQESYFNLM